MKCVFMSQHDSILIRKFCTTVTITAAKFGDNAKVFQMTSHSPLFNVLN